MVALVTPAPRCLASALPPGKEYNGDQQGFEGGTVYEEWIQVGARSLQKLCGHTGFSIIADAFLMPLVGIVCFTSFTRIIERHGEFLVNQSINNENRAMI